MTPEIAQKGIGSVGAVPLPDWLWQIYVSPRQEILLSSAEEVRKVRGPTADMLSAIAGTGALQQLSRQEADALGIPWSPTATAFTIPKNETKARLILHVGQSPGAQFQVSAEPTSQDRGRDYMLVAGTFPWLYMPLGTH